MLSRRNILFQNLVFWHQLHGMAFIYMKQKGLFFFSPCAQVAKITKLHIISRLCASQGHVNWLLKSAKKYQNRIPKPVATEFVICAKIEKAKSREKRRTESSSSSESIEARPRPMTEGKNISNKTQNSTNLTVQVPWAKRNRPCPYWISSWLHQKQATQESKQRRWYHGVEFSRTSIAENLKAVVVGIA